MLVSFMNTSRQATHTKFFILSKTLQTTRYPAGGLIEVSGILYGTTRSGGTNGDGTIYSFNLSNNTLTTLIELDETVTGKTPYGSLLLASNGLLIGTCEGGGSYGKGTLFVVSLGQTSFGVIQHFDGTTSGKSSLWKSNRNFFGINLRDL